MVAIAPAIRMYFLLISNKTTLISEPIYDSLFLVLRKAPSVKFFKVYTQRLFDINELLEI